MRFRHADGSVVHLAYCSNVHQAEDVDGVVAQLARFAGPVRRRLDVARLGVGLWLSAMAVADLRADHRSIARLRDALAAQGLEVVTLNGFPYRGFHDPVVKYAVYRPDWTEGTRLDHTLDLARILGELMPDDAVEGTISTLPIAWRMPWDGDRAARARVALERLAEGLAALDRTVRVGLEPEPGCAVETTEQAASFLAGLPTESLGICLDACHHAVQFEDAAALPDVPVVKAQVSSALRSADPRTDEHLTAHVEPRFLHQTRERVAGAVRGVDDLDEAIAGGLPGESEWRVHFHVPVHAGGPATTQDDLRAVLRRLLAGPVPLTRHLEVETYTWTVLPPERRPDGDAGLVDGLTRELDWTRGQLVGLGLERID